MSFFNSLFSKKAPYSAPPVETASLNRQEINASLNEEVERYQEQVLQKFVTERAERISRLANWEITELQEAIRDFREELAYCKIVEGASMCRIFEEKIYQLNAAIEILEKNQLLPVS